MDFSSPEATRCKILIIKNMYPDYFLKDDRRIIGIIAEKGSTTWIAKLIKWFTRSEVSHVEFLFSDGSTLGAKEFEGVRWSSISAFKDPDIYLFADVDTVARPFLCGGTILDKDHNDMLCTFLSTALGKGYSYRGIFNFIKYDDSKRVQNEYFCSQLIADALRMIGRPVNKREASNFISPQDVVESLQFIKLEEVVMEKKTNIRKNSSKSKRPRSGNRAPKNDTIAERLGAAKVKAIMKNKTKWEKGGK